MHKTSEVGLKFMFYFHMFLILCFDPCYNFISQAITVPQGLSIYYGSIWSERFYIKALELIITKSAG